MTSRAIAAMTSSAAALLFLLTVTPARAGHRPELDASAGLSPAPAARAQAARARASQDIARLGTPASFDSRYDVPTMVWAVRAQAPAPATAALRGPRAGAEAAARRHLGGLAGLYRLGADDVGSAPLRYVHDTGRGGVLVAFRQAVGGIEVFRDEVKVLMDRDHRLVAVSGYIPSRALAGREGAPEFKLSAERALQLALDDFTGGSTAANGLRLRETSELGHRLYDVAAAVAGAPEGLQPGGPVRVRRTLFHMPDVLVPAWQVELMSAEQAYLYVVDAADGRLLFRHEIMASDAFNYRVWAQTTGAKAPHDGPQGTGPSPHPTGLPDFSTPALIAPSLVNLQNSPFAHNDPWLAPGATETLGNNVDAYADLASPDGLGAGDFRATTSSANTFDRTYDTNLAPGSSSNQRMASITQLFYDNNFFHDWYYDSGFDEASGNGQTNNFGRGGLGNDAMRSEAQDYGGTNNANMSTPPDGSPGRMQMYVFNPAPLVYLQITAPPSIAGTYAVGVASGFGAQSFDLTNQLLLGFDAVAPVNDGCTALQNGASLVGKIAILDRGTCGFAVKALEAQSAGAIGCIVVDNLSSPTPPGLGGSAGGITIPVLSVTLATGNAIKGALGSGAVTGRMFRQPSLQRDGTIDNQIVAHEWGHFISNRLIGDAAGLSTNMSGGLGEGWADFHSLLLTVRSEDILVGGNPDWNGTWGMGSYALFPSLGTTNTWYFGIRRCPYSSDLAKNGLLFRHIQQGVALPVGPPTAFGQDGSINAQVHRIGEVWCSMLFECYTALLRDNVRLTFEQAQQRMKDYLVLGYKLTPNAPTLLEARDALLLAAYTNDIADFHAFWTAFAKRGAGAGAVGPDRYSLTNIPVIESFAVGGALALVSRAAAPTYNDCDQDGYLDNGEVGTFTLTLKNTGSTTLSNTSVTLSSGSPYLSFPNGNVQAMPSVAPFSSTTVSIPIELSGAIGPEFVSINASYDDPGLLVPGPYNAMLSMLTNVDEVPSTTENVETLSPPWVSGGTPGAGVWSVVEAGPGDHRFHGDDYGSVSDHTLTSPPLEVAGTGSFSFTFTHNYSFEFSGGTNWDGGVVELSTDGTTWNDIGTSLSTGYGGTITNTSGNPLGGRPGYVANSPSYPALATVTANLGTAYQGQTVRVRFRVGTDAGVGGPGWQISTLTFSNLVNQAFLDLGPNAVDCATASAGGTMPRQVSLALASANPSPGQPSFRFGLPAAARVHLAMYDVSGRRVATLVDGEEPAGWQTRTWTANDDGSSPRSGMYFARMVSNGKVFTSRVVLSR